MHKHTYPKGLRGGAGWKAKDILHLTDREMSDFFGIIVLYLQHYDRRRLFEQIRFIKSSAWLGARVLGLPR